MLKNILTFSVLSLFFLNTSGQNSESAKNTIYYEIGGTGYGWLSLNYDRLFYLSEKVKFTTGLGLSLSKYIDVGGTKSIGDNQLFLPVQFNLLIGQNRNNFEFGFGMPIAIKSEKGGLVSSIYVMRLGYRFQPKDNGLVLRASLNPSIILLSPTITGGLSLGYVF